MNKKELLDESLKKIKIEASDEQLDQLLDYYDFLIKTNETLNLTRITEFEDVVMKHFVDSCAIGQYVDLHRSLSIIDIGTGAGFPGIPLKIIYPELSVTLADSLNKRIRFLEEVIQLLSLENIRTIHSRAEDLGKNCDFREKFDLCVSRAVANLSTLSELAIPLVKVGGNFISYKSGEIDQELKDAEFAVGELSGRIKDVLYFQLPGDEISRSFVMIEKVRKTKKKYPRKAGTPSKNPLQDISSCER
ncbi:16S rRNA (guanine(527)-N(7))-methyltransferase RsmG [Eubacterium oxidoreducens]|uniref:Ribosomal RNA small subunit methyltransferase G n=1 Tax=Eubacterium oxidoreducens TaxID=1732 RepID=A0A1G6CPR5_EUBOX|nr:16S rRNA (guanine(527)-N(7))-methyltransferase RsmG [Eubacterium oxidoreducens]SDB34896.1 16S rRNA m(7)G-527 methyltransferase [Eubacterium oxidoreducens]